MVLIATLLLLGLAILVFVARRNNQETEVQPSDEKTNAETSCASCTSHTDSCMHDCLMTKAVQAPEYFDDEELERNPSSRPAQRRGHHADRGMTGRWVFINRYKCKTYGGNS